MNEKIRRLYIKFCSIHIEGLQADRENGRWYYVDPSAGAVQECALCGCVSFVLRNRGKEMQRIWLERFRQLCRSQNMVLAGMIFHGKDGRAEAYIYFDTESQEAAVRSFLGEHRKMKGELVVISDPEKMIYKTVLVKE